MSKGLLIDVTRCVGCGNCEAACQEANHLPASKERRLSATRFTVLEKREGRHVRKLCRHCLDPACVSVCPVAALEKTKAGPVIYHAERCMGCRYCMVACPFSVPKYEWDSLKPRVRKCIFCFERQAKGEIPACAEACGFEATVFGERDELLAEARRRIQAEPAKYQTTIYGEHEVGGTSVLYLSDVPFEKLGFPVTVSKEPLPSLTFEVLSKIPNIVTVGAAFLFGIRWLVGRRMEIAETKEAPRPRPAPEEWDLVGARAVPGPEWEIER